MANTIKPKADPSPKAEQHKENRYARTFAILAADNKLSVDQIAKKAGINERAARSMIFAWNTCVRVLDSRAALAVDPTTLIHDAADAQNSSQRVIRVLVQEGVEIDISELAKRANASQGTARRVLDLYRSVISAQGMTPDTRNGKGASEHDNNKNAHPTRSSGTSGTSAMKAKAA